jgi:endoglucanase
VRPSLRQGLLFLAASCAPALAGATTPPPPPLGVNFGCGSCGSGTAYGTSYTYDSTSDVDTAYNAGVRVLRIGLRATRLESKPGGTLDPNIAARLYPLIDHARAKNMIVILDMHDYGNWFGKTIGANDMPLVIDLWSRAFAKYKSDAGVMPSFMNEPHLVTSANIWPLIQSWVSGMRGAQFKNTLVVPGAGWSSLQSYSSYGAQSAAIKDPLNKLLHDGHAYFDSDNSGTHTDVLGLTSTDLANPTTFAQSVRTRFYQKLGPAFNNARTYHYRFLVGETALPDTDVGRAALPIIAKLYAENSDVIGEQTWWVYTSWMQLPKYMFGLMQNKQPSVLLTMLGQAKAAPAGTGQPQRSRPLVQPLVINLPH